MPASAVLEPDRPSRRLPGRRFPGRGAGAPPVTAIGRLSFRVAQDIAGKIAFHLTPPALARTGQALPVNAGFDFT
ncbi:MAG TPA: hypothetical protein VE684_00035 [Crenalkalicoccus sp.]|jgi:hypothetical protein|nr:hypothetical protein [Crenalkalicoccus sp.]